MREGTYFPAYERGEYLFDFLNSHTGRDGTESERGPILTLNPCADADSCITIRTGDGTYNVNPPSDREPALKQGSSSGPRLS